MQVYIVVKKSQPSACHGQSAGWAGAAGAAPAACCGRPARTSGRVSYLHLALQAVVGLCSDHHQLLVAWKFDEGRGSKLYGRHAS
jgi:hypothetical protein